MNMTRTPSNHPSHPAPDHGAADDRALLLRAVDALGGGALVLDASLRVVAATPSAELVLGAPVRLGIHAVKLLCGDAVERPLAEALAAGRPVVATVPRLGEGAPERLVRVRARPLRAISGPVGWIVQLAEETSRPDDHPEELHGLWTRDVTMKRLFRLAERVARCDASVLVRGEMGTGKASLAAAIHELSARRAGRFCVVSCTRATPALLERRLSGHAYEGAPSPADPDDPDGGTLFLDDVEQLPLDVQGELLRVLESGVVTPRDGDRPVPVDIRVIAATHASLQREVEAGRFRADLLYRLRIASLHLPPLRARRGDVALLAERFIAELNERGGRRIERVAPEALSRLEQHDWPGNVRELRAAIESAFATGEGPVLLAADLPSDVADPFAASEVVSRPAPPSQPPSTDEPDEATRIRRAIERAGGDRAQAATTLGMSRTTLWRRMRALGLLVFLLAGLGAVGCAAPARFALRPPVLRDTDDRPLARAPAPDEESDYANALDVMLFRPLARAFLFELAGEAHNVSSIDEVPDSTWFTNRTVTVADLERGPCPDAGPVPPFTIKSSKTGGSTPGFAVKDARGQRYMFKLDGLVRQPEISTAADAVVARLYWAVGFNAPCNDVTYVAPEDLRIDDKSYEGLKTGEKIPLRAARVAELLRRGTPGPGGKVRMGASRFIDGQPVGTWRTEGTRKDDPNDVIPHEDRRELRGERLLAAWINHWDSRGPNTFDAFVEAKGGGGHLLHYFLDFSDSLGGVPLRTDFAEPRMGFTTVSNVPAIATDALGFGFVRRPWDEVHVDPRYPNLGYLDVEHFDPMGFSPQTPLVRWKRADPSDLGWMARRIARLGEAHVRVAVRSGKLTNAAEEARLMEILMGRREKILRASFARTSPITDLAVQSGDTLCATDLGVLTGLSAPGSTHYTVEFRKGMATAISNPSPVVERAAEVGRICMRLPAHFAEATLPDDAEGRYATLDVIRLDSAAKTTLRAHFYDLGPARGYVLAGIERP